MNLTTIYDALAGLVGLGFLTVGLRRSQHAAIATEQRMFWLSLSACLICGTISHLVNDKDIWLFGALVGGFAALLTFLIWRFPKLMHRIAGAKGWDTPTT